MKCYYSPTNDAVGICKACGRGLSREHLVEFQYGLACKGRCEDQVTKLTEMISNSIAMQRPSQEIVKRSGKNLIGLGIFLLLLGGVFLWQGLKDGYIDTFSVAAGGIFAVFGASQILRGVVLSKSIKEK